MGVDVCEVLQVAMELEEDAWRFYQEMAGKAINPLARRTFEALAEWEVEHKELLQSIYDEANVTRCCPALPELTQEQIDMMQQAKQIFQAALEDLKGQLTEDPTLENVYATAMEKERAAITFYRDKLRETDNENEQMLFEFLLGQERGHLNLLATTEEYLNDTKYWHFKEEQWIVTG